MSSLLQQKLLIATKIPLWVPNMGVSWHPNSAPNYHHSLTKCDQSWCVSWGQRCECPTTALLFNRQVLPQLHYQMKFSTSSFIS